MNSTNNLTGKDILTITILLIIGGCAMGVMCWSFFPMFGGDDLKTATEIEKLKADAMTDYWEQMEKYTHIQGAAGQSITETPTETKIVGAAGQSITETADEIILVGAAGQTMVIKK